MQFEHRFAAWPDLPVDVESGDREGVDDRVIVLEEELRRAIDSCDQGVRVVLQAVGGDRYRPYLLGGRHPVDAGNGEDRGGDRQDCHEPKDTFDRPGHAGGTARAGATPNMLDQAPDAATQDENGRSKSNNRPVREVQRPTWRGSA